MSGTKFCVYCGVGHSRRGRCCCPEHGRKVSSALSTHRAKCRTILDRIAAEQWRLRVLNGRWRDVAMGRDPREKLAAIFGVTPPD